jgi:hypothetical protein
MSDEPFKKPAFQIESPRRKQAQAELSADLETGPDPLYSERMRRAKSPPSEATYVSPIYVPTMQMPTRRTKPSDLAAAFDREGAKVVIDESGPLAEPGFDIEVFDDSTSIEDGIKGDPASDERVTRRTWAAGKLPRSGLVWLTSAAVALVACGLLIWTKAAFDSNTSPVIAPSSDADAKESSPSNVPVAQVTPAATTTRAAIPVGELPIDSVPPCPPVPAGFYARSGPSEARMIRPKGRASDVDPLFIDSPGY